MEEEREFVNIQASSDSPAVFIEVPKGTTLPEVLERALAHMGPDNPPFEPPVREYGPDRFQNALIAAGITVPAVRMYDLEQLVGPEGRSSLDSQAGVQRLLDELSVGMGVPKEG